MIIRCLENLPRGQFELYCYTTSDAVDALTKRIQYCAQRWQPIRHLSDEAFTQQVRDDEVDILIDLSGHNTGSRMRAIAMQPAPLLVKWVGGLINTTGVQAIDYLISDHVETPEGEDEFYTEKLIRLPDDYIAFDPPEKLPALSELPAKQNGYITLACFNNPTKLNDVTLKQWAGIMHELPDSRLLLKGRPYTSESFCERLYATLEAEGIARERLIIEGPGSNYEMLDAYNRADIALDPWPYSGGLTTCEAFIMGVPVVTLPGPTFAGRHSATHLVNAGMPELVVNSWEDYRARVIELASDLESLDTIRQHLRGVLLQSPVCDGPRFAKHFTDAMRAIWQRYCDDKAPAALTFNKEGEARFEDEDAPVEIHYAEAREDDSTFQWQFDGKLIAVDNGGQLLESDVVRQLLQKEALELIAFDPSSRALDTSLKQHEGVHYYPNATLGDGQPGQLHACLDPKLSASLAPLDDEYQPEAIRKGRQVLTRLPLNTIALDSIQGLPAIDWLVLDDLNDAAAILDNGTRALKDTLLLQVKVAFQPTHERQPNLAEIQHWASRNGFRFYRLHEPQHYSHLPEDIPEAQRQATELASADALLLPSHARMKTLSDNQRTRLAFLLHTVFGTKDLAFGLLEKTNAEDAKSYLHEEITLVPENPEKKSLGSVHKIIKHLEGEKIKPIASNHSLPGHLVVSLTSYKSRFENLHLTLRSLLLQEVHPDLLILWIAQHEKSDIPDKVWELEQYGLQIQFCEDFRSYKKIVPTLVEHPDSFIVTADDDIYYQPGWLQALVASWDGNYKTVTAHRAHKIRLDKKGNPTPYCSWKWQVGSEETADGLIFPTSGAGTLYPPRVFHEDVTKPEIFMELCPDTDDIWLYWMALLNGAKAKRSNYNFLLIEWHNKKSSPLWQKNIRENGNDSSIKNLLRRYKTTLKTQSDAELHSFLYRGEEVKMFLPNKGDHIQKIIKTTNSFYEAEMLEDIKKRLPASSVVLDIGSNIGNHSIFFGKFCQAKQVIAFEPHPKTFSTLKRNIRVNNLERTISCHNTGIAESIGYSDISFYNPHNIGMTKLERSPKGRIKLQTVDSIVKKEGLTVGAMKIDVEGMELNVLKGAKDVLKYSAPLLYIEAGNESSFRIIEDYLSEFGYEAKSRFNATATYLFSKNKKTTRNHKKNRWDNYFNSKVIVTGCGRSGTRSFSQMFSSLNKELPHEKILNHELDSLGVHAIIEKAACLDRDFYGESSWLAVPFINEFSKDTKIIYLVRDPIKVAKSLYELGNMRKTSDSPSIRFAQKIIPQMATDNELHNACAYAIHWNKMALERLSYRDNFIFFDIESPDIDKLSKFLGVNKSNLKITHKNKREEEKIKEISYGKVKNYIESVEDWGSVLKKIKEIKNL